VLAILDDPAGAAMQVEITNTAAETVRLAGIPAGTDAAHLELEFRAGVLAADAAHPLAVTVPPRWTARTTATGDCGLLVALTAEDGVSIAGDETVRFGLLNIAGDGRGGTRGTRVSLRYDRMAYARAP